MSSISVENIMTNSEISIYCVNSKCDTLNPLQAEFCSQCGTPVIKRYLWCLGDKIRIYNLGDLICDRYLLYQDRVLLDTKPGINPSFLKNIPSEIKVYLKLFPHRLHLPQVYGVIGKQEPIWLLEFSSIKTDDFGQIINPKLFPYLVEEWPNLSSLRQLNLLWQMIKLWQPLATKKVASSLLDHELLRLNGSIIQLLELKSDQAENITLQSLGDFWSQLSTNCNEIIQEFLKNLSFCLQEKLINDPEKVLQILDQVIYHYAGKSFYFEYQIICGTHTGRKRSNNEDSCYPTSKKLHKVYAGIDTLTMVCDGLGGQEGGEIASKLAIRMIKKELFSVYKEQTQIQKNNPLWSALIDEKKIINAIYKANDKIFGQNIEEKRKERARMGTTLVASLAIAHEIYLAHVGDSRIYWITEDTCHQVTMDDDLLSKEVRSGNGFYRDTQQHPQSGALLQALGTNNSQSLHPHVQRLMLDQNCVFLLCSDGLSDFDRVEQHWKKEILPVINQELDLVQACKNLINIGVNKNGHDNVTVSLVYCQLKHKLNAEEKILSWPEIKEIIPSLPIFTTNEEQEKPLQKVTLINSKKFIFIAIISSLLIAFLLIILMTKKDNNKSFNPNQNLTITMDL